ncbi:DUF6584 family protein [Cellulomonas edaphi]|uniref:Tetratricopeptide repeat protein n=1 Tax=Cellulomonas edaphi TaxID=3053468 RepID=A0ABT7SAN0_9CELL|nr:DUF6584 family protein [Cellulomons edaphi]MDM7832569.1 hypothetical protein [Cellulomons edaphi]
MPIEQTLVAVDELIAAGDLRAARVRLRDLVREQPRRLDLRARLADVYRREGNAAQAGRWSYLKESRVSAEDRAFERLFQDDPVQIMAALRWRGSEDDASDPDARARLAEVRARAQALAGRRLTWEDPLRRDAFKPADLGCLVVIVLALGLATAGAVAIFDWLSG